MIDSYDILKSICLSKPYRKAYNPDFYKSKFEACRNLGLSQGPLLDVIFTEIQLAHQTQRGFIFEKDQLEILYDLLDNERKMILSGLCFKYDFESIYKEQKELNLLAELEYLILTLIFDHVPESKARIKKEIFS